MGLIKKYPLESFFVIVFSIMYLAGIIGVYKLLVVPEAALWIVGSFAPTIAAVIVLGISEGKTGIKKLFGYSSSELIGKNIKMLMPHSSMPQTSIQSLGSPIFGKSSLK